MAPAIAQAELIILAAPLADDPYYEEVQDDIFDFQVDFARQIIASGDRPLILTDEVSYPDYAQALGDDYVAIMPMQDIWIRDFASAVPDAPILFRYTAAGQAGDQRGSDAVQADIQYSMDESGMRYHKQSYFNDGGNVVEDSAGNAVISRKFLKDNAMSESEARAALIAHTNLKQIAFIEADEQGGLEHADGVVSFLDERVLIVNDYPSDPDYAASLRADLKAGLPDVVIHTVPAPYDGNVIYDEAFGSACGLYTNAVVTPERVYVPQFGIAEDEEVLTLVRSLTKKQVVPVQSGQVCMMGGGVRCLSWQLREQQAEDWLAYIGL